MPPWPPNTAEYGQLSLTLCVVQFYYPMVASAVARVYRRSPILANSISSVFFFALSDWFAQKAEKASDHIDKKRVAAVAMCGPIFNGLPLTLFYEAMDKHIGTKATFRVVGRKLLAMQFIYMPISVPSFLFLSTLFHRLLLGEEVSRSVYRAKEAATSKWAEAYLASWFVWPVSDTFNFTVVQKILPAARPTWDCVVDVGWNAYLSWRGIGGHSITEFAAARP